MGAWRRSHGNVPTTRADKAEIDLTVWNVGGADGSGMNFSTRYYLQLAPFATLAPIDDKGSCMLL
jgi:hypothetical protein